MPLVRATRRVRRDRMRRAGLGPGPGAELLGPHDYGRAKFSIERRPATEPAVIELIETRVGELLSLAEVRESITHLYSLGRFQDVQVDADGGPPAGVELRYNLVPTAPGRARRVQRHAGTVRGDLRAGDDRTVRRDPSRWDAPRMSRALLEQLYADRGYFAASIRPSAEDCTIPMRTILTFNIDAGPQARDRPGRDRRRSRARRTRTADLQARRGRRPPVRASRAAAPAGRLSSQHLKKRRYYQAAASHTAQLSDRRAERPISRSTSSPDPLVDPHLPGRSAARQIGRKELVPIEREGSVDEDLARGFGAAHPRLPALSWDTGRPTSASRPQQTERIGSNFVVTVRKGPALPGAPSCDISGTSAIPLEEIRPLVALETGESSSPSHLDAAVGAIRQAVPHAGVRLGRREGRRTKMRAAAAEGRAPAVDRHRRRGSARADRRGHDRRREAAAAKRSSVRRCNSQPGTAVTTSRSPARRSGRDAARISQSRVCLRRRWPPLPSVSRRSDACRSRRSTFVEGPQTIVDHVIVVGNRRTDEELIRRELAVAPGRAARTPGPHREPPPPELARPVPSRRHHVSSRTAVARGATLLVTVEEAPATNLGYGGGLEVDEVDFARVGEGGEAEERIELRREGSSISGRRNLGGKNRSVNLFTRGQRSGPNDSPEHRKAGAASDSATTASSARSASRAPFGWNADFTLTGAAEQGERSSFNFTRKGVTAELARRLTPAVRGQPSATRSARRERFDERLERTDQAHDRPLVSAGAALGLFRRPRRDTRDDVVEPGAGTFLSAEGSSARARLGGQVGFAEDLPAGRLVRAESAGAAASFSRPAPSLGLADGFPREVQPVDDAGQPASLVTRSSSRICRPASGSSPAATPPSAALRSTPSARPTRSARTAFPRAATRS